MSAIASPIGSNSNQLTSRDVLNLPHDEHTVLSQDFTKYAMLAIEERCWCRGNEELRDREEGVSFGGEDLSAKEGSTYLAAVGTGSGIGL